MTQDTRSSLLDGLFTTHNMREVFCDRGRLDGMLRFEAALASAQAREGIIPNSAAASIELQCRAELFDVEKLANAAALAGNLAIPLVKQLTELVALQDPAASDYVHFGATSQDAIDTGLVLQLFAALDLIEADLSNLAAILAKLAETYKNTPMAGRTWLQQAVPVTFGLKAAGWLSAIERDRSRLRALRPRVSVIQFGGAAGTLAALGAKGLQIADAMARDLGLAVPDVPWHVQRDRFAEVATTFGLLAGTLGKIARDISLLMQTEIAEVSEPAAEGRGVSSAMPQKHNPVGSAVALSAAIRIPALVGVMLSAMVQENERGMGNWHAEWETLPEICLLTAGSLQQMIAVLRDLKVDTARMERNLHVAHGQIFAEGIAVALTKWLGRAGARKLVEEAVRTASEKGQQLSEILSANSTVREHLSQAELLELFNPSNYLGLADTFVDRVLRSRSESA